MSRCTQCGAELPSHSISPVCSSCDRQNGGEQAVLDKRLAVLLFTDIVGSVEIQQALGTEAYTRFVTRHDEVFKECLSGFPGVAILNETGDGFLVRFSDPADAVRAALRLQTRFAGLEGQGHPLQVRIGLHMGMVQEMAESVRGEVRAVGMPINIAARIMGLAEGGQILMTRPVYDDARQYVKNLPAGAAGELRWLSHGAYRIKGCDDLLELYEVGVEGVAPLRAPQSSDKAWRDGANGEGEASVEMITPEEIEQSDVLISYAPVDDRPLTAGGEGWVTRFHRNLSVRLEQLCGEAVKVLRCPRTPDAVIPDSVIPSVGRVRTMVPVLSPPFVKSDQCCRVVEAFGTEPPSSSGFHKELLKAVKTPVSPDDIPLQLAPVLTTSLDYRFYEEEPETGRFREYDEAFGVEAQKHYYERVYDLAFEVSRRIQAAKRLDAADPSATGEHKVIFLAEATSDLQGARDRMRRELLDAGHTVLPDRSLPLVAEDLEAAMRGYLEQCDLAIHFVGGRYGWIPDGATESLGVVQNRAAAERSASAGLPRIVWIPRDVEVSDERQAAFIKDLEESGDAHCGAEVIRDTVENLKGYLRDQWKREAEAREKEQRRAQGGSEKVAAGSGPAACPRVYLICDQRDEAAVEALEDFLFDQGVEVSLPSFEGEESEISEVHWGNLADCDGALVYYGAAGKAWVDYKLRELVKAAGYRGGKPITVQAVYLAPPFDRRKERFRSLSAAVFKQDGESFDPASLQAFVDDVKAASSSAR